MEVDWKGVLGEIVSDSPNAFIEGRKILDSIIETTWYFFWLNLWNVEFTIKERQPDIFLIATDREDRVENYIKFGNGCFFFFFLDK